MVRRLLLVLAPGRRRISKVRSLMFDHVAVIDRAIATRFADKGARVCLADKRAELVHQSEAWT